jgi:hypothetical protein
VASRGVRVPWGQEQALSHTCTLLADLTPGAVCCLGTAGLLWGCPLPLALQNDLKIHLAKAGGATRPVRKGVAGHRLCLRPQDVAMLDGVPVTSPARTWLDLASVLDLEELVAAGRLPSITTAGTTWKPASANPTSAGTNPLPPSAGSR